MNFFGKTTQSPTVIETQVGPRSTLTFSVEGFAAREELLLKGYIRLLDYLTEHQWQYHEPSTMRRVDLLIASAQIQPTRFLQAGDRAQPVLQLGGDDTRQSAFFLTWPLKPNELEKQLNRLGRLICSGASVQTQGAASHLNTASARPGVARIDESTAEVTPADTAQLYSLRQWPKPMLLAEPGRMRLATLISGRGMSLDEIVLRSALPASVCERFLADMQTAGLLAPQAQPAQPDPDLSRIVPTAKKPRLEPQHERQFTLATVAAFVQPGLLSRIRMRLGIKSPPTH